MTQIQALNDTAPGQGHLLGRIVAFVYGVASYLFFFVTFLYAIGFVEGMVVPQTLDTGASSSIGEALLVDCGWFVLFAIQHSGMARTPFKARWTKLVPPRAERSTYVLVSAAMFVLLVLFWRPIPTVLWDVTTPALRFALIGSSFAGWGLVLASSFSIDHFELFGLRQVIDAARGTQPPPAKFRVPALYAVVRHPLYLGFVIASWATPHMTVGHLVFAIGMTSYVLVGMYFEERDLVRTFGDDYRRYAQRVPALLPWPRPRG